MAEAGSNLRNEDFRKLLAATPRRTSEGETRSFGGTSSHSFTHRHQPKPAKKKGGHGHKYKKEKTEVDEDEEQLKEIMKNYRDRAAERRDQGDINMSEASKLAAAYRAVPGTMRESADKANMRKKAIEDSKYLGGDMEHTHLVKGLDYSLLNKVRSEIHKSQDEADQADALEKAMNSVSHSVEKSEIENKMAKNINRILFKDELPPRNELFGKGRMAYVVEVEDEESEIPTTLIRSLHDCPKNESNTNINANMQLISKLTQVLAYLRADHKKKKKNDMTEDDIKKTKDQNIFDNEQEYIPSKERERDATKSSGDKDRDRDRKKDRNYFDDSKERRARDEKDRDRDRNRHRDRRDERDRRDRDQEKEKLRDREREKEDQEKKRLQEKFEKRKMEAEGVGYDECYPGGFAEMASGWDSDEEDFSKMDQGNKKPPIKRWDFENQEDYEKYQGGREALPKAAYQFGVKPSDGRKTRKSVDVNKKIDRELQQISQIMEKRKTGGGDRDDNKRPKY